MVTQTKFTILLSPISDMAISLHNQYKYSRKCFSQNERAFVPKAERSTHEKSKCLKRTRRFSYAAHNSIGQAAVGLSAHPTSRETDVLPSMQMVHGKQNSKPRLIYGYLVLCSSDIKIRKKYWDA